MAHHFQHFAHLAVAAFAQGNFYQRVGFSLRLDCDAARCGLNSFLAAFFGNENTLLKNFDNFRCKFAARTGVIGLLNAMRRVSQQVQQVAVVGKQEQT